MNGLVDPKQIVTALISGLLVLLVGAVAARWWRSQRITWTKEYDQAINHPYSSDGSTAAGGSGPMWNVSVTEGNTVTPVKRGSFVILRVRNTGAGRVVPADYKEDLRFTFPGRRIVNYKVRGNEDVHKAISGGRPVNDWVELGRLRLDKRAEFQLMLLLDEEQAQVTTTSTKVAFEGDLKAGTITGHGQHSLRNRLLAGGAAALVILLAVTVGVILRRVDVPDPSCADGHLALEGSSAFAPIAATVVNEYQDHCTGANITIAASGSTNGVDDLARRPRQGVIAMSDGLAEGATGLTPHPVGVVFFAVVANRDLTITDQSTQQLQQTFAGPGARGYVAVGRTGQSGTRRAFDGALGMSSQTSAPCPEPDGHASGLVSCDAPTTMDLLTYVNKTPNAIGYAEADALSFFSNVRVVSINGVLPSRKTTLDGTYHFVATEYLYTYGPPRGLTADFLSFLTSDAMATRLRDLDYIGCRLLSGSRISGACK